MDIRSGSRAASRVFTDMCKRSRGGNFARLCSISEGSLRMKKAIMDSAFGFLQLFL
jgi:hypothetical protein